MFCLKTKASLLILSLLTYSQGEKDYCRNDLCPPRTTHIACMNRWSFGNKCSTDVYVMRLEQSDKDAVVKEHILLRQKWASGNGTVHRKACKMATMGWDQDLADLAELNARSCGTQYDTCRNTETYRQSGQNIFMLSTRKQAKMQNPAQIMKQGIALWTKKKCVITSADLDNLKFQRLMIVGHLTMLINEKNTKVGCAIVTYSKKFRYYIVTCNYAVGNSVDTSVYTKCPVPGSGCGRGSISDEYPPLCA